MEAMQAEVADMLKGVNSYNPKNIPTLEEYVELQAREQGYDLEANLCLLRMYQLFPEKYRMEIVVKILMKALSNMPHTDFMLCKCLLNQEVLEETKVKNIMYLADLLEMCQFKTFWEEIHAQSALADSVVGFQDAVRKYVCHVISITYQSIEETVLQELLGLVDENAIKVWTEKYGWKMGDRGVISLASQEEIIKSRNITEKIDLESVASIMATCL